MALWFQPQQGAFLVEIQELRPLSYNESQSVDTSIKFLTTCSQCLDQWVVFPWRHRHFHLHIQVQTRYLGSIQEWVLNISTESEGQYIGVPPRTRWLIKKLCSSCIKQKTCSCHGKIVTAFMHFYHIHIILGLGLVLKTLPYFIIDNGLLGKGWWQLRVGY